MSPYRYTLWSQERWKVHLIFSWIFLPLLFLQLIPKSLKIEVQSNLAIRNDLIRNKLVLRNNFRATKKFLIAKFDCISWSQLTMWVESKIPIRILLTLSFEYIYYIHTSLLSQKPILSPCCIFQILSRCYFAISTSFKLDSRMQNDAQLDDVHLFSPSRYSIVSSGA